VSHLATRRLGELVDVLPGFAFDAGQFGDSGVMPIVRIRDVIRGSSSTLYRGNYDDKFVIRDGDILIGMDGEFNRARWRGGSALLNQRVCRIASSSQDLDNGYLFHFLPAALKAIEEVTPFATVKHLSAKTICDIKIPVPPLAEQVRIARVLDQAEALRAKRRAALAQLDNLTQAIFLDMFGDPGTNPMGWPIHQIGDLLQSASYGTSEKSTSAGKFAVLRMNNITRTGEIDLRELKYMSLNSSKHDRYLVKPGDVLFNRTNSAELVGKSAIYRHSRPMAYAGYLVRLRVNPQNDAEYLAGFLNTGYAKTMLRKMCKSIVGMANINAKEIQAMKIAGPALSLQRDFASRIASVERLKTAHRASLTELDALFASLQHRAFRGAVR
jgi:type I restriction enzyme, S subunit